ncbi:DUF1330 domain-containing protein [Streptomyces fuscigenes]|uniref:DUF1330 domain-containing protein n=1 Tax=Streptomyces fuscigenes TaxID=1528880 RepID=UPI001F312EC3|nr:DUF1330 domain-containing protein [Streptomyces fuscigenes]MCF3963503.1 DUF1330 domain-containing protein [Streptomyces fuscigenes]
MTAYAIAHLADAEPHEDVCVYMERIQETLDPFGGRFAVHGGAAEVVEGAWPGAVVVVAFPGMAAARAWYGSEAYRAILPLRTDHIEGDVVLVPGVPDGYDAGRTAARLRAAL